MKTYNFKVVIEPDDDQWHAYCPALKKQGASTGEIHRKRLLNIFVKLYK